MKHAVNNYESKGRGFESLLVHQVGAKRILLRLIFCHRQKISHPPDPLPLLFRKFRKKSRSARLFGCKRPHDGSLSLPTFCELREFNAHLRKAKNIFFIWLGHKRPETVWFRVFCDLLSSVMGQKRPPWYTARRCPRLCAPHVRRRPRHTGGIWRPIPRHTAPVL